MDKEGKSPFVWHNWCQKDGSICRRKREEEEEEEEEVEEEEDEDGEKASWCSHGAA